MKQLLELNTTNIQMEMHITPAKLQYSTQAPSYEMTRQKGGLEISSTPARLNIDTYEARSSMGFKKALDAGRQVAEQSFQSAKDGITSTMQGGNALMNIQNKQNNLIGQLAFDNVLQSTSSDVQLAFLPSTPANISWEPHDLSMRYEMDKLNFEWRTSDTPDMEYTPAKIEFLVKEYPKLEITYVGGPIYAPPSADPNYVPMNVTA
ncbi:MAG: DUF6470 family protein [Clostridiales bacterium]|nr:DUF6470 family protein [Clostridiales bacterium]